MFNYAVKLDEPVEYVIIVQGRMENNLTDWFTGPVRCETWTSSSGQTITVFAGMIADQAALHGLISRIRDLGLILLHVDCITSRHSFIN